MRTFLTTPSASRSRSSGLAAGIILGDLGIPTNKVIIIPTEEDTNIYTEQQGLLSLRRTIIEKME